MPYLDQGRRWSVGFGHLMQASDPHVLITQEEADALLDGDIIDAAYGVSECVTTTLTQCQFDAVTILTYNIGGSALQTSHLLRCLNAQDFDGVAAQWMLWDNVTIAGVKTDSAGLYKRRAAELAIFERCDYSERP